MAEVKINDLAIKNTPIATDEIEIQETGGGTSFKTTIGGLTSILGASITGFSEDNASIGDDITYAVADVPSAGEVRISFLIVVSDTTVAHPSAIFSISYSNIYTVYANADSWDNGNTANNDTDTLINIWCDASTSPDSVKIKNRTGSTATFRFFTLTIYGT